VACAVDEFGQRQAAPDVQRAHPLGGVQLVACHGEEIHGERPHVHRDLPHRLGSVRVDEDAALARHGRDLGDRLDGPHLVVGQHEGDQDGVGPEGGGDLPRLDQSVVRDGHLADLEAVAFQVSAHPQDGRMLDG
jgi:hypothetical protein